MKNKERKQLQRKYAKKNIDLFFSLLEERFCPNYDTYYIKELLEISKSFNIRLSRTEKLKFCKKCFSFWNKNNLIVRTNPKKRIVKYMCKNCNFTRNFRYK